MERITPHSNPHRILLQLQLFPKMQKNLDPPLIHFAQFWFCLMLNKDYFYEGNVLMFELIFPRHRNYFGFLSRESSRLRVRRCGKESNIKS